jgi:polyisoprenoid-binding protein YceI
MRRIALLSVVIVLFMAMGPYIYAAPPSWTIDPVHSGFYFGIQHIYATVNGFFEKYGGTIQFDPDNLKDSRVALEAKVKSINTNHGKRDGHLLSDEFFDAKKYPVMTFESTSIEHVEGNAYTVEGVLTIKDVSKKIKVPATFFGITDNPFNPKEEVAGFEARLTIDRLAYNVGNGKYYKMGVIGKDVDILISLEAIRKK